MSTELTTCLIVGLLFLLIFLSGYWLHRTGKPYAVLGFNAHKFIALGAAVYVAWFTLNSHHGVLAGLELAVVIIAMVFAVATVVSGGLLSTGKPMPALIAPAHKVLPYLTVLTTALTAYLLLACAP